MTSFWRSDALVARKNTSVPKNTHELADRRRDRGERGADDFGRVGFDRNGLPGRGRRHDRALDVVQHRERIVEHAQLFLHGGADLRRARDPFGERRGEEGDQQPDHARRHEHHEHRRDRLRDGQARAELHRRRERDADDEARHHRQQDRAAEIQRRDRSRARPSPGSRPARRSATAPECPTAAAARSASGRARCARICPAASHAGSWGSHVPERWATRGEEGEFHFSPCTSPAAAARRPSRPRGRGKKEERAALDPPANFRDTRSPINPGPRHALPEAACHRPCAARSRHSPSWSGSSPTTIASPARP